MSICIYFCDANSWSVTNVDIFAVAALGPDWNLHRSCNRSVAESNLIFWYAGTLLLLKWHLAKSCNLDIKTSMAWHAASDIVFSETFFLVTLVGQMVNVSPPTETVYRVYTDRKVREKRYQNLARSG